MRAGGGGITLSMERGTGNWRASLCLGVGTMTPRGPTVCSQLLCCGERLGRAETGCYGNAGVMFQSEPTAQADVVTQQ